MRAYELMQKGGIWLGRCRQYIQRRFNNGSDVTWSSGEVLSPPVTVKMAEEMCSEAAAGAIEEYVKTMAETRTLLTRLQNNKALFSDILKHDFSAGCKITRMLGTIGTAKGTLELDTD